MEQITKLFNNDFRFRIHKFNRKNDKNIKEEQSFEETDSYLISCINLILNF